MSKHETLEFDPPEKVFDPNHPMEPTPLGTVSQEISRELDPPAQQAIHEAQQKERDFTHEFNDLRSEQSIENVPGGLEEYKSHLETEQDDYEERMIKYLDRNNNRDHDNDHDFGH